MNWPRLFHGHKNEPNIYYYLPGGFLGLVLILELLYLVGARRELFCNGVTNAYSMKNYCNVISAHSIRKYLLLNSNL